MKTSLALRFTVLTLALSVLILPTALRAEETLPAWQKHEMRLSGKVDDSLVTALGQQERVRVIAMLDVRSESGESIQRFSSLSDRRALRSEADRVLSRLPEGHVDLIHRYGTINSLALEADAEGIMALMALPGVSGIGVDERQEWSLAEAVPSAGIKPVRGQAKHGKGVWVAVLDSGIDTNHKDLKKPLKMQECFCFPNCCPNGASRQSGGGSAEDDVGHGTLVSGSVVSRGKVAPSGPARNAKLLHIKVGGPRGPATSDSLAALDWIAQEKPEVRVINMSFGTTTLYKGNCDKKGTSNKARSAAIKSLRDLGILAFAAAGNDGSAKKMSAPACIKDVVSVGAIYDDNVGGLQYSSCADPTTTEGQMACFSDRSKTTDLMAPGALITAPTFDGGAGTTAGTSFASPIAAGCAVLVRKQFPDATTAEVEEALESSSTMVVDPINGRRYPALDCEEAFEHLGG